jgi:signal transduction histidine kinase/DNA-binding NarL/FixJ family response regulator/HPt (histidine-containing phosphotransfer) domain-containing protein
MEKEDPPGESGTPGYSEVLLELSPSIVLFLDSDNTVFGMSSVAAEYFNLPSPRAAEGKGIFDLVKNPVLKLLFKKWFEKLNKGMKVDEVFPLDRKRNDQYEWFNVRAANADRDGRLIGKVFYITDVTELYSQKKILDTLMGSIPGQVMVFDRSLQLILASDAIARGNGFASWRDLVGRNLRDIPKVDVTLIESMLDRIILFDEPIHEIIKYRVDGELRWYYADLRTIKSSAGTFGYILTQFDITGEIKPKAILEALMDSATDEIAIINPAGIIEYASRTLIESLGFTHWHSVVGHPWGYLFRHADPVRTRYADVFGGEWTKARRGTFALDLADGRQFYNFRVDPLMYQKESFGVISIATNTTELVAARERAESATVAKSAFLANMTHELRTPMNGVLGMNELLSRTHLAPIQQNYVAHIRSSATMLLSIINDILDFSRIEAMKMELQTAPFGLGSLAHDVVNLVAVKLFEKELSFTVDVDPATPSELIGDELRIKQILVNLLNNAVKFTNQGEINLAIFPIVAGGGKALKFTVRDTGVGIPKERQGELFSRFSRVEGPEAVPVEGSGLGLAICKGLVNLMAGELKFESEEGVGSTFTVVIPQGDARKSEPVARLPRGKFSLLAYDPDPYTVASIERMARFGKYAFRSCKTLDDFRACLAMEGFPWTHVIFDYRGAFEIVAPVAERHQGVRWLALLSMIDFVGKGKVPSINLLFKPLVIPSFARFIRGEDVDFTTSVPMVNSFGFTPITFKDGEIAVLIVDDSQVNRKVAEGFLQTLGIVSDEAESGVEALKKAGARRYDLVLMDHMMPGMDGLEATRKLREIPGYAEVPIIALTANTGATYLETYRKAGMDDTLCKPIEFNAFVACLKKWLSGSQGGPDAERASVAGPAGPQDDAAAPEAQREGEAPHGGEPEGGDSLPWIAGLDRAMGIQYTGSERNLEMILKVFYRTGPKMLEQLESGRRSGAFAQFRAAAHSLISSIANIGGTALSAQARELEEAIIGGKVDEIDRLYPAVHEALERLIADVGAHLALEKALGDAAQDSEKKPNGGNA